VRSGVSRARIATVHYAIGLLFWCSDIVATKWVIDLKPRHTGEQAD
jgi:hypothetical protein